MGTPEPRRGTPRLLDVTTTAARLGVSPFTVRAWVRQRRLAHAKLGRRVLIPEDEVERFIARNLIPARESEHR